MKTMWVTIFTELIRSLYDRIGDQFFEYFISLDYLFGSTYTNDSHNKP